MNSVILDYLGTAHAASVSASRFGANEAHAREFERSITATMEARWRETSLARPTRSEVSRLASYIARIDPRAAQVAVV